MITLSLSPASSGRSCSRRSMFFQLGGRERTPHAVEPGSRIDVQADVPQIRCIPRGSDRGEIWQTVPRRCGIPARLK